MDNIAVAPPVYYVNTLVALRYFIPQKSSVCMMLGSTTILDGNGRDYFYDALSTTADDGVFVIAPSNAQGYTGTGRWLVIPEAGSVVDFSYTAVSTTPYTVKDTDYFLDVDTGIGDITLDFPAVATRAGRMFEVRKSSSDANTVIIDPNAAETINGLATKVLFNQYDSVEMICTGSAWDLH